MIHEITVLLASIDMSILDVFLVAATCVMSALVVLLFVLTCAIAGSAGRRPKFIFKVNFKDPLKVDANLFNATPPRPPVAYSSSES